MIAYRPLRYPASPVHPARRFDAVAEAYARGATLTEAADAAGVPTKTAWRFLHSNGLARTWAETRVLQRERRRSRVLRLVRLNYPARAVAAATGLSVRTVYRLKAA